MDRRLNVADRIEPFSAPIPAGTAQATPLVTNLSFADGQVTRIIVTVPPGPSGFVGFQLWHKGGQVIPYVGAEWVIADDRVIDWPVTNFPTADGWQIAAYNTDIYDHTLYLEFLIDEIPVTAAGPIPLLNLNPA